MTTAFHNGPNGEPQLSTINGISNTARGIELDVTFAVGEENPDPFDPPPIVGITFARVSLQGNLGAGIDLSSFSSSAVDVTTTLGFTAQSFIQTDYTENGTTIDDGDGTPDEMFAFNFWEHNDGIGVGGPTLLDFDFADASQFNGDWNVANPQAVQGTDAVRQWGMQLAVFDGSIVVGQPINATILIESRIPEPTSIALVGLALLGLVGCGRRRT